MSKAILLDQVSKNLGNREVLKDISFAVQRGDIFGYLGPNGASKTTTIRIILGLFRADYGKAYILGQSVEHDESRCKVGFVLEADGLYDNLNARENLDFYCQLYRVSEYKRTERIEKMLHLVGLQDRAGDRVSTYSKGMRQKLALVRAMVHDAEILVLDEPTAGVDPSGQIKVYGELEKLEEGVGRHEIIVETVAETEDKAEVMTKVIDELRALTYVENCYWEASRLRLNLDGQSNVSEIVSILSRNGIGVEEIKKSGVALEEIYAKAVREAGR